MSFQQLQSEIQQKQQLIYSLQRKMVRNELSNAEYSFKIGILQDEIQELSKKGK